MPSLDPDGDAGPSTSVGAETVPENRSGCLAEEGAGPSCSSSYSVADDTSSGEAV